MDVVALLFLFVIGFWAIFFLLKRREKIDSRNVDFINKYPYPKKISDELNRQYPHLSDKDIELVVQGLKQYFIVCYVAGKAFVSMPSKAVDIAWHELILFTKLYNQFCMKALGRFLHHTPAEAMETPTTAQDGIKTAWRIACKIEGINPGKPSKLPLLFAIDSLLNIPGGFKYRLNCDPEEDEYCAGAIGCGSGTGYGCGGGCGGSLGGD